MRSRCWASPFTLLVLAAASCTEPMSSADASSPEPSFGRAPAAKPIMVVRSVAYIGASGFEVDVEVAHGILGRALGDADSRYIIDLFAALRQGAIMGDLPTVTADIAQTTPVSSTRFVDVFRLKVPWNGTLDGTSITGLVDFVYLARLTKHTKTSSQLLAETTGLFVVDVTPAPVP